MFPNNLWFLFEGPISTRILHGNVTGETSENIFEEETQKPTGTFPHDPSENELKLQTQTLESFRNIPKQHVQMLMERL